MFDRVEYRITIGTEYDRNNGPIDAAARKASLEYIGHHAAKWFGGYTICESKGGWIAPSGSLVEESGIVLSVLVEDRPDENASDRNHRLIQFGRQCGRYLDQESVCVVRPDGSACVVNC